MPFFSTILFHLLRGEEKSGYEPATPFSIIGLGEFSKEIYLAENWTETEHWHKSLSHFIIQWLVALGWVVDVVGKFHHSRTYIYF